MFIHRKSPHVDAFEEAIESLPNIVEKAAHVMNYIETLER